MARDITFTEIYDPSLPPVLGNRDQLIQVFLNLVKNAAEAWQRIRAKSCSPRPSARASAFRFRAAPTISLPLEIIIRGQRAGRSEGHHAVPVRSVRDDQIQRSGLGLALVAKIVGDHGGVIDATASRAERGSASSCPADGGPDTETEKDEAHASVPSLADDDAAIRMVLNQALTRAGYDVRPRRSRHHVELGARGEGDLLITESRCPTTMPSTLPPKASGPTCRSSS